MSSLGFQGVYGQLNKLGNVVCERVFISDTAKAVPALAVPGRFDVLVFSVSFELDYPAVLEIIECGGISLFQKDRTNLPLVFMGGICAFTNPEPLAPFVDGVFLGDSEVLLVPIFETLGSCFKDGISRDDILLRLSQKEGFYVPSLYNGEKEAKGLKILRAAKLSEKPIHSEIVTPYTEFRNKYLIEITRGCVHKCPFCVVGNHCNPFRVQEVGRVQELSKNFISPKEQGSVWEDGEGVHKVGFVGPSIADHPNFKEIIPSKKGALAIASIRADCIDEEIAELLRESGYKTVSMAPEVGSERLINLLEKGIRKEHIENAVCLLISKGIINFRLYFIIGLPGERESDILELVVFVKNLMKFYTDGCRKIGRIGNITLSINPFIPKPFTPFQWAPMEKERILKNKVRFLKKEWRRVANLKVNFYSISESISQALLSLGGRETSCSVLSIYKNESSWKKVLKEFPDEIASVVFSEKKFDHKLPWEFMEEEQSKLKLWKRFKRYISAC